MTAALTPTLDQVWRDEQGLRGQFDALSKSVSVYGATKPWNTPWGRVAQVTQTGSSQTGITTATDITGMSVTFTAVANRIYRFTWNATAQQVTSAGTFNIVLADGAATSVDNAGATLAANSFLTLTAVFETSSLSGSVTRKLRAGTTAGTLSILNGSVNASKLFVDDMGPSAAPS